IVANHLRTLVDRFHYSSHRPLPLLIADRRDLPDGTAFAFKNHMNALPPVLRHLTLRSRPTSLLGALVVALALPPAHATTLPEQLIGATQAFLERAVSEHLERSQIQGRSDIEINRLDPRLRLPLCDKPLDVTLESPAQPIGRVTTRVRCDGSSPWTVFV